MTSQQARKKLEALVENSTTGVDIMAAVDVAMLAVHVAVCGKVVVFIGIDPVYCGQPCDKIRYCDKAPRRDA